MMMIKRTNNKCTTNSTFKPSNLGVTTERQMRVVDVSELVAMIKSGWWLPRGGLHCPLCPVCSGHNPDYTKAHRCTPAYQVEWGFNLNSSLHHLLLIQLNTLSFPFMFPSLFFFLSPRSLLWLYLLHLSLSLPLRWPCVHMSDLCYSWLALKHSLGSERVK